MGEDRSFQEEAVRGGGTVLRNGDHSFREEAEIDGPGE